MTRSKPMAAALLFACWVAVPGAATAQLEITGQLDLLAQTPGDSLGLNRGFRGDGAFNPVRLRLFARHWLTDRIGVFTELLYDIDADARINGAYVVVNELGELPWLNARLGLAPSVIGSFGLRSTYFNNNPLVGVPLVWQYRTNLSGSGTDTAAGLTSVTSEPGVGMPILYDSCWNIQWELLGEVGRFEYSVGLTAGSLSNPIRSRSVDGSTWLARVGVAPVPGLRVGVSGAEGPYLSSPTLDAGGNPPYPGDPSDYDESLYGADVEYQSGAWLFQSELYRARFEAPLVSDPLDVTGGFAELRYDFAPGWYAAARLGGLFFDDIVADPVSGAAAPWDRDTRRTELALGYRLAREALVKLDWQRTAVPDTDFVQNLFAVQLSTVF